MSPSNVNHFSTNLIFRQIFFVVHMVIFTIFFLILSILNSNINNSIIIIDIEVYSGTIHNMKRSIFKAGSCSAIWQIGRLFCIF